MFDPSRAPTELPESELIGSVDGEAPPVVKSGDLRDELQETLEAHARIFRKAALADLKQLEVDPEFEIMFGELAKDAVLANLAGEPDDDALFRKARTTPGPARDRYIRALGRFVRWSVDGGVSVDELIDHAGAEYEKDFRDAAELTAA
jgi:hypothetical protein